MGPPACEGFMGSVGKVGDPLSGPYLEEESSQHNTHHDPTHHPAWASRSPTAYVRLG